MWEEYLSKGIGEGSQGRARRPAVRSVVSWVFWVGLMAFSSLSSPLVFGFWLLVSGYWIGLDRTPGNKKPPGQRRRRRRANAMWRSPSGKQQDRGAGSPHAIKAPSHRTKRQGAGQRRGGAR